MTLTQKLSPLLFALPFTLSTQAYEFPEVSDEIRDCYSKAMIGFDSVINARLGVPAEHALTFTYRTLDATPEQTQFLDNILIVVWGGYLWKRFFGNCVDALEWLIHQVQFGVLCQGPRQEHALLLPAGKLPNLPMGQVGDAHALQSGEGVRGFPASRPAQPAEPA